VAAGGGGGRGGGAAAGPAAGPEQYGSGADGKWKNKKVPHDATTMPSYTNPRHHAACQRTSASWRLTSPGRQVPPGMEMFEEMAWKKAQKKAKADWEATNEQEI
jgi:hypothetical protein